MRTEAAFWTSFVRPALHCPADGRVAWRIPGERYHKGIPDAWFGSSKASGFLELKYVPEWPKRSSSTVEVAATADQLAHLREAEQAGNFGYVLIGVEKDWALLHWRTVLEQPDQRFLPEILLGSALAAGKIGKAHQDGLRLAVERLGPNHLGQR
jgi:hypothetical protein